MSFGFNAKKRLIYLKKFEEWQRQYPGPIEHSITLGFEKYSYHVVVNAVMHGNEFGTLPSFLRTIEELLSGKLKFGGKITLTLGNVPALIQNVRFIDDDLNREFNSNEEAESIEKQRTQGLASVIQTANFFLDFHQTIEPTYNAFYIFKNREMNHLWARCLAVTSYSITSESTTASIPDKQTAIEFANIKNIPALVLEVSERGWNPMALEKTYQALIKTLEITEKVQANPHLLEVVAKTKPQLKHLKIVHREPFDHRAKCLKPRLVNFQEIKKGMKIGKTQEGKDIVVAHNGYLLFPKYPKRDSRGNAVGPLPASIFAVAQ